MLLLHWPRETSSRKAQHDDRLPDYKFEEQNYDHILSSRPHEDDKSTCEFIITRLELIRGKVEDRNIEVFQAWFRRREISDTGSISISSIVEDPVVCKVAYGSAVDSLKKEDKHYTKLRELQGTCIPKIHGFFIGTLTTGVEIAVLVMEDCGAQLGSRLKFFPSNIRYTTVPSLHLPTATDRICVYRMAAFQSLLSVHRKGILHGDFKERNMLYRQAADGSESVTLTDFGESQDHECDFDFNQEINLWDKAPDKYLCGCIELYYAGQRADIWTPRKSRCTPLGMAPC